MLFRSEKGVGTVILLSTRDICQTREKHTEPLVVRFVDIFIENGHMQQSMDPIDAIISEYQEATVKHRSVTCCLSNQNYTHRGTEANR